MTTQILIGGSCKKVRVNGDFIMHYIVYHSEISNKTPMF